MKTEILPAKSPSSIPHAVDVLRHGGLVAFPTDTVYGLAAWPFDQFMLARLFVVKGRKHTKAIAVLMGNQADLEQVAEKPSELALLLAKRFWPGPITLIVPRNPRVPKTISPAPTIGVRVPNHPVALDLLRATGPLAVTSANLSGRENANTAAEVLDQLEDKVHLILDGGKTPGGIPSTVVDCTDDTPTILRPGPITMAHLQAALAI